MLSIRKSSLFARPSAHPTPQIGIQSKDGCDFWLLHLPMGRVSKLHIADLG